MISVTPTNLNINLICMHRMSLVEGVAIAVSKPLIHVRQQSYV